MFDYKTTEKNLGLKTGVNNNFFDKYVSNPKNDIIFTHTNVVDKVLDTVESQDPEAFNSITKKYCDIGCKSGAYLCGIAERIFNSPKAKEAFPNKLGRWRHILKYQVFGVTSNKILQRTSQMRVYNIKDKDGEKLFEDCWCNIISTDLLGDPSKFEAEDIMKRFNEIDNFTTVEDINKYGERETKKMSFEKFDYIIGNPPYQVTRGGTKNVDIWPEFVEKGAIISNKMCMIHPGRWVVPTSNRVKIREMILNNGLTYFDYYPDSESIFENTSIGGGISITYFDKNKDNITYSINNNFKGNYNKENKFFENIFEEEAFNSVWKDKVKTIEHRFIPGGGFTNGYGDYQYGFNKCLNQEFIVSNKSECKEPVKIWSNMERGKGSKYCWCYIDKKYINEERYSNVIKSRKVMISATGNCKGGFGQFISNDIQVVDKDATAANVFFIYPEYDTDYNLNLLKSYFETKTVRFLMSITQKDIYVKGFENVPDYTYFIDELNGELFTDEFFYNKYNFSKELIDYIESHIAAK